VRRLLLARVVLGAIGVAIWGYGVRNNLEHTRIAAMLILLVAFLFRFLPKRWFETPEEQEARERREAAAHRTDGGDTP
jgi:hypothetical protein